MAEGEQLLELVDDHPGVQAAVLAFPVPVGLRDERSLVGARGLFTRGEHPDHRRAADALRLPQSGDQPRPQQRRLAAAGRARHHREPVRAQQLQQLAGLLVPAEEEITVTRFETGQAPIGCPLLGRGRPDVGIRLPPAPLPLVGVGVQYLDVRPQQRERGQLVAGRRLGQRGRRVSRPLGHLPVRRLSRLLAQQAQFVREPLHGPGLGVHRLFSSSHRAVPFALQTHH
jgi:hypothetical protein